MLLTIFLSSHECITVQWFQPKLFDGPIHEDQDDMPSLRYDMGKSIKGMDSNSDQA